MEKTFLITNDLLATSGKRFINWLVDKIISYLLVLGLVIVIGVGLELSDSGSTAYFAALEDVNPILDRLLTLLLSLPYFMIMELLTGKTIGKLLTGTVVVDRYGNKPQNSDMIKRNFARLIPFDALSFLGSIPRGWHDSLSDTYVVEEKELLAAKSSFENLELLGKSEEVMVFNHSS
jgi:uncharacterized RDD family membrane protein YckC